MTEVGENGDSFDHASTLEGGLWNSKREIPVARRRNENRLDVMEVIARVLGGPWNVEQELKEDEAAFKEYRSSL